MFDLGFGELMLIGIVALIVVGPKDLPGLFRSVGQFVGKARGMAREFSRAMESAADEAGIKDVQKTLRAATNPKSFGTDALKKVTGVTKPGGATETLSKERAEFKSKMDEKAATVAADRKAREAAAADAAKPVETEAETPEPAAPKAEGEA